MGDEGVLLDVLDAADGAVRAGALKASDGPREVVEVEEDDAGADAVPLLPPPRLLEVVGDFEDADAAAAREA